ncbi:MAG: crotonase, partial [Chloroflexota bacterium]
MTEPAPVLYEVRERVALITLNRPERLNAMNGAMSAALRETWRRFRDDREAWVAIITGAGERAFCAGADVRELAERTGPPAEPFVAVDMDPTLESDFDVFKPIIAAING